MKLATSLDMAIEALQQRIWYVEGFKGARGDNAAATRLRRTNRIATYREAQDTLRALRLMLDGIQP